MTSEVTKSGDFQYRIPLNEKQRLIKETIEKARRPITPQEISSKTKINVSTVKKYLKTLENRGFIKKKFHGHYASVKNVVTFGSSIVGDVSPRVHCLRLRFGRVGVGFGKWVREFAGVVRVTFMVHRNGSATVFVRCVGDSSLDVVGFRIVVALIQRELGVTDEEFGAASVVSYELNTDFQALRLNGVKALTLSAFDGAFWRVYNKRGFLRSELKATKSLNVANVLALMSSGISQYNILQLMFLNFREIRKYVEVAKFQNKLLIELVSQNRMLIDAILGKGEFNG